MRYGLCVLVALGAIACDDKNKTAPAPSASASASAAPSAEPSAAPPPSAVASAAPSASASGPSIPMYGPPAARFADVTAAKPVPIRVNGCDQVVLVFVKGKGSALGENLGAYDFMLVFGEGNFDVKGDGTAIIARVAPKTCTPTPTLMKRVARASDARDLAWAGGAMHARFGLEGDGAPVMYAGRLEGTAPVAEHTHPGTYEMICTIEASGVFTLDGNPQRLAPSQCVVVPPDVKHSWQPSPKSKLVAVQFYAPPGPEQRFRALAADAGK